MSGSKRDPLAGPIYLDPVPGRISLWSVRVCEQRKAVMYLWPKDGGAEEHEIRAVPFLCHSYRCRRCGPYVFLDDHRRIAAGIEKLPWWLYTVITFDRGSHPSPWDAYRDSHSLWHDRLYKRLRRHFPDIVFIKTWERHVQGSPHPHMNLVLGGASLQAYVEQLGTWEQPHARAGHGMGRLVVFSRFHDQLCSMIDEAGFGRRGHWSEILRSETGIAAYLAKAASNVANPRFKSGDQTPYGAPKGFRRLAASQRLLPPRQRGNGLLTGFVVAESPELHPVVNGRLQLTPEEIAEEQAWRAVQSWMARHKPGVRVAHDSKTPGPRASGYVLGSISP